MRPKTTMRAGVCLWILGGLLAVLPAIPASAQAEMRASLFAEVDALLADAEEARADLLAPKSFGEFRKLYDRAEMNFEKGQQIERIREDLVKATGYLTKAIEATALANVTFAKVLDARADAAAADSAHYAPTEWADAEAKFTAAAGALEAGDVNAAKKQAEQADAVYRSAELNAIKVNYFQETRDLLAQADKTKVSKYAPKTLQRSKDLLAEAEALLEQSRYDTDGPRALAREAKYEAKHAINMAGLLAKLDTKEKTAEDLMLQVEAAVIQVAGEVDVMPMFDEGYGLTSEAILDELHAWRQRQQLLEAELGDAERTGEGLREQVAALEKELGGVSKERAAIEARMKAEAQVRAQFARVESMFTRQEAQVYRQQNDLLIRMVGLNFAVGKSTIEPQYFSLLTKVQNAIKTFPGCRVTIEGHTDALGTDEINLKLSQERADAVRQYLIANMNLPASRIEASGYGESKPIASNETDEGRAKNRRIDLVIRPEMGR